MIRRAMILAAGFGTRMLPITRVVPKALLPVQGRPLLEWNLRFLSSLGVEEAVVNAHHLAAELHAGLQRMYGGAREVSLVGDRPSASAGTTAASDRGSSWSGAARRFAAGRSGLPPVVLLHEAEILGTAGGIANAAPFLIGPETVSGRSDRSRVGVAGSDSYHDPDAPVLVMNADLLFRPDIARAEVVHQGQGFLATLICARDPLHAQIAVDEVRVREIHPRPVYGDPELWAFTGVYLLSPEAVERLRLAATGNETRPVAFREIVPDFREWMRAGRLGAMGIDDLPFRETGTPEAYLELLRDLEGPARSALLDRCGAGPGTRAGSYGWIEAGAVVGADTRIEASIILEGAVVASRAVLRRAILASGARVEGEVTGVVAADGQTRDLRTLSPEDEEEILEFLESTGRAPDRGNTPGLRPRLYLLQGDGSSRRIVRVVFHRESRIVVRGARPEPGASVIYPHRRDPGTPSETETFAYVARYLGSLGVPVPRIDGVDFDRGLLLQEDLGNTTLFDLVRRERAGGGETTARTEANEGGLHRLPRPPSAPTGSGSKSVETLYREAVRILTRMHAVGRQRFEPQRTHNIQYDGEFARRFEAEYFHREMVRGTCGLEIAFEEIREECETAARVALNGSALGFLHRDFQSRNLMATPRGLVVIDFQGARLGPSEYDLASLLLDPYAALTAEFRETMLRHYMAERGVGTGSDARSGDRGRPTWNGGPPADDIGIQRRYRGCGILRMMQALGAYAYLGDRKGKPGFLEHAPVAAAHLEELAGDEYPRLASLARQVSAALPGESPVD